jgi:hypothetical protein
VVAHQEGSVPSSCCARLHLYAAPSGLSVGRCHLSPHCSHGQSDCFVVNFFDSIVFDLIARFGYPILERLQSIHVWQRQLVIPQKEASKQQQQQQQPTASHRARHIFSSFCIACSFFAPTAEQVPPCRNMAILIAIRDFVRRFAAVATSGPAFDAVLDSWRFYRTHFISF